MLDPHCPRPVASDAGRHAEQPLRIAVIGGGFTGVAFIIHAIRASLARGDAGAPTDTGSASARDVAPAIAPTLDITVLEPAAELGRGIAYRTTDPLHRINVPVERMSLFTGDPDHALRWLTAQGALDHDSADAHGHHYVSRQHYGDYVAATLRATLAAAGPRVRLTHRRVQASALHVAHAGHRVILENGTVLDVDRVALCCGHAAPAAPCALEPAVRRHLALLADPWAPGALARIGPGASVLLVGTGLTMADVALSLLGRAACGPLTAISRRGLLARPHGVFTDATDFLAGAAPPASARALLRGLRQRVAREQAHRGWQPAVDALRSDLPVIWRALPALEQRRIVKRLLPFWDVHRFRAAPQVHAALGQAIAAHRIVIETCGLSAIETAAHGLRATLRRRGGGLEQRCFDYIVFCTGPAKDSAASPLLHSLLKAGRARSDAAGIGLDVDPRSRVLDSAGTPVPGLFAFGPLTRGSFGEMSGAPDITRHLEGLLQQHEALFIGPARSAGEP